MLPGAWRTAASSPIACASVLAASAAWSAAAEDSLVQPLVEIARNREPVIVHAAQLAEDKVPTDRYIDSIDQKSYLLADAGASNRKFVFYWLGDQFSGIRFGECKYMTLISGEVPTDYIEGGFGGSVTSLAYGALYNLWLDPKETRNFLIRKLPYISVYEQGIARHLGTIRVYPPKRVVEMPTR